jgi:hypothetical protein
MLWPVGPSLLSTTHVWCAACCVSWVGVEPGGVVVGVGVDTLLSPEASAVRQVPLWGRGLRAAVPGLPGLVVTLVAVCLGGCVSCELDSGREHLRNSM